jgi:hypothetical protein
MTQVIETIRNGVDSEQLYGTLDAIKAQPERGSSSSALTTTGSTGRTTARPSRRSSAPGRRTARASSRS